MCIVARCESVARHLSKLTEQDKVLRTDVTLLIDLEHVGQRHLWAVSAFKAIFNLLEANYPERLFRVVLVRTPWIFSQMWGIVKPMLHPGTAAKLKVLKGIITIYISNPLANIITRFIGQYGYRNCTNLLNIPIH